MRCIVYCLRDYANNVTVKVTTSSTHSLDEIRHLDWVISVNCIDIVSCSQSICSSYKVYNDCMVIMPGIISEHQVWVIDLSAGTSWNSAVSAVVGGRVDFFITSFLMAIHHDSIGYRAITRRTWAPEEESLGFS